MSTLISAANGEVWPQWLIFGVYMAVILAVAVFTRRKNTSVEGFMFAGKGIGGWLSAFAYGATYFSAVVFVGYAGKFGWNFGLSAVWIGVGNMLIGTLAAWVVLASRTKRMTTTLGARTMPEFFEKRYESKYIKLFAALTIFIFLLPYSASVYQGMGYIFEAALGIDATWCILILAGLTAIYLFLGGYFATSITDFIQGIIMIVGIIVTVMMLLANPKMNWGEGLSALFADPDLTLIPNATTPAGGTFLDNQLFNVFVLVCLTSFGMWGMPQSIKGFHRNQARCHNLGCVFRNSGLRGVLHGQHGDPLRRRGARRKLRQARAHDARRKSAFRAPGAGDCAAVLGVDVHARRALAVFELHRHGRLLQGLHQILIRVLCLVFVAVSAVLAIVEVDAIVSMMSLSWGAIAGCFIGPYVYGLYSKKANKAGAYASIAFSLALTFSLIIGLGYFKLRAAGLDPGFSEAFKTGIGQSPFIGVVTMAASMIVTPLANLAFSRRCAVSNELLERIFPPKLPVHLVYTRGGE